MNKLNVVVVVEMNVLAIDRETHVERILWIYRNKIEIDIPRMEFGIHVYSHLVFAIIKCTQISNWLQIY